MLFPPIIPKVISPNVATVKLKQNSPSRASGNSVRVSFPDSARSDGEQSRILADMSTGNNPFKVPSDRTVFYMRTKERQRIKEESLRRSQLKVHEKSTFASSVKAKMGKHLLIPPEPSEKKEELITDEAIYIKPDPQTAIRITRGHHIDKGTVAEYIAKKRDIFRVNYAIKMKRDEIRMYDEIYEAEVRKLELIEQNLEEDAVLFDTFIKENDANSAEALRIAEEETKARLDKMAQIRKVNADLVANKSEIAKKLEILRDYRLYRQFLENLTPPDIRERMTADRNKKLEVRRAQKKQERALQKTVSESKSLDKQDSRGKKKDRKELSDVAKTILARKRSIAKRAAEYENQISADSDDDSDEDLELYFTDPQQLLDMYAELEEQNLFLIQNNQKTEEDLDELKQKLKSTEQEMGTKTSELKAQIRKLTSHIEREEKKANNSKTKVQMYTYYGSYKREEQEKMLNFYNKIVARVYRKCTGSNEACNSTLRMLAAIENHMEDLFDQIESLPKDRVEAAEKAKEKENRLKMREQKLTQQRLHQEERVRKAMERSNSVPKKQIGRKVVYRSKPPDHKKRKDDKTDQALRDEAEYKYFFTWQ